MSLHIYFAIFIKYNTSFGSLILFLIYIVFCDIYTIMYTL